LAQDANNLYWTGAGAVYRVSKDGGAVTTLADFQKSPSSIAVDATRIYFNEQSSEDAGGAIVTLPIDADGGVQPTALYDLQDAPYAIAIDATNIYWTNRGVGGATGAVMEGPLVKGSITPLATGLNDPRSVDVDATYVYWAESGAPTNGQVGKTPIGGGPITSVATTDHPTFVRATASAVFFFSASTLSIESVASDGGVSAAAVLTQSPGDLWANTQYLYYTTGDYPGTVNAIPLDGGAKVQVWGPQGVPYGVLADAVAVYWLDGVGNALWKLAK
jgi:hypothetical protein